MSRPITVLIDYYKSPYWNKMWYPKKVNKPRGKYAIKFDSDACIFCDGRGDVQDLKTGNLRPCVGCGGKGIIQKKAA